jgi:hypothetical protein
MQSQRAFMYLMYLAIGWKQLHSELNGVDEGNTHREDREPYFWKPFFKVEGLLYRGWNQV